MFTKCTLSHPFTFSLPQDQLSRCPATEPPTCYDSVEGGPGGGTRKTGAVSMVIVAMTIMVAVLF